MTIIYSECGSLNSDLEVLHLTARRPLCNHNRDGTPCMVCSEMIKVESQIEDIHSHLKELHERHRALREKGNDFHDTISKLPYDIASEIFFHCLPPTQTDFPIDQEPCPTFITPSLPLVLGAVCHSWRRLVYSIPRLWSTISIEVYQANLQLINHYIQWSASATLVVRLHIDPEKDVVDVPPPSHVFDAIALVTRNFYRLAYLCLDLPCRLIKAVCSNDFDRPDAMPLLKELHVHCWVPIGGCTGSHNFTMSVNPPRPYKVMATSYSIKDICLDWNQVCHLYLGKRGERDSGSLWVAESLSHLSEINQLRVVDLGFNDVPSGSLTGIVITQNSIRNLRLYGGSSIIMSHTTMPNLESLRLWRSDSTSTSHLLSFLQRSACHLKILEWIPDDMPTARELIEVFQYTPKLQQLYFNFTTICSTLGLENQLVCFLEQLGVPASQESAVQLGNRSQYAFLPLLRKFVYAGTIEGKTAPLSLFLDAIECRSGTIEGYRGEQPLELTIYLPEKELESLPEVDRQRVLQLNTAGRKVSILGHCGELDEMALADE